MKKRWQTYEEVATYLLDNLAQEFNLERVEGKQKIEGRKTGTSWEIDAKGVLVGNEGFVIIECRCYTTSKQNQGKLGSLAYRILDTGAEGGIIVSPLGIQEGAAKIAAAENIFNVTLDEDSTTSEYVLQFLNKIFVGMQMTAILKLRIDGEVIRVCQNCGFKFEPQGDEKLCPDCSSFDHPVAYS